MANKVSIAIALLLLSALASLGQQKNQTVVISDPAPVILASLFSQADLVAYISIQSGDAEHYNAAIYKALVTQAFKGAKPDQLIYFGPFVSYGIGGEYLVFLKKTDQHLVDLADHSKPIGPFAGAEIYYRVMYEGYSVMPVAYECIFDGNYKDKCDYGVWFNIYQVKLPPTLKAFPVSVGDFPADKKAVRRDAVNRELSVLVVKRP
jgi:hypothetical protein